MLQRLTFRVIAMSFLTDLGGAGHRGIGSRTDPGRVKRHRVNEGKTLSWRMALATAGRCLEEETRVEGRVEADLENRKKTRLEI